MKFRKIGPHLPRWTTCSGPSEPRVCCHERNGLFDCASQSPDRGLLRAEPPRRSDLWIGCPRSLSEATSKQRLCGISVGFIRCSVTHFPKNPLIHSLAGEGSNLQPTDSKSVVLPIELPAI